MRTKAVVFGLVGFVLAMGVMHGAEPPVGGDVPFWELPKTTLELQSLAPADVKLVAGPDMRQGMILLQTGDAAPVADFAPTRDDLKILVAEKDAGYAVVPKGLVIGTTPFGDRKYKLSKIPKAFDGLTLLQTKMGHKAVVDATYSITVSAAKPCLAFLALDQRVIDTYMQHGTPGWLKEFVPTGETMKTDEPVMAEANAAYQIYVRPCAAGRIVLGPPSMDVQFNSMYFAFFGELNGEAGR
jgi:hypothetical protein